MKFKNLIVLFSISFGVIGLYDGLRNTYLLLYILSNFIEVTVLVLIPFLSGILSNFIEVTVLVLIPFLSGILLIIGYYFYMNSKYDYKFPILFGIIFHFIYRVYALYHWNSYQFNFTDLLWFSRNFYEFIIFALLIIFIIVLLYNWKKLDI
jgi:hypothetical protein